MFPGIGMSRRLHFTAGYDSDFLSNAEPGAVLPARHVALIRDVDRFCVVSPWYPLIHGNQFPYSLALRIARLRRKLSVRAGAPAGVSFLRQPDDRRPSLAPLNQMQPNTDTHSLDILDQCTLCRTVIPLRQAIFSDSGEIICPECQKWYFRKLENTPKEPVTDISANVKTSS